MFIKDAFSLQAMVLRVLLMEDKELKVMVIKIFNMKL